MNAQRDLQLPGWGSLISVLLPAITIMVNHVYSLGSIALRF
jgi:hypothetical protein